MVEAKPVITLKAIKGQFSLGDPAVSVSVTTAARGLDRRLINIKKLMACSTMRNSQRVKAYARWYMVGIIFEIERCTFLEPQSNPHISSVVIENECFVTKLAKISNCLYWICVLKLTAFSQSWLHRKFILLGKKL